MIIQSYKKTKPSC